VCGAGTLAREGLGYKYPAEEFLIWDLSQAGRQKPEVTALAVITIFCVQPASGGCCQWVLAAACEAVEWLSQPLGFESLALRSHSIIVDAP
jgi:hypothetical protein